MYFIGVDLGTSAVKLLLMDEEGRSSIRTLRKTVIRSIQNARCRSR